MKKLVAVLASVSLGLMLVSCASTKSAKDEGKSEKNVKKQKSIEYEVIDWDGNDMGGDRPTWPLDYNEDGVSALPKKMQDACNGKVVILVQDENSEKKLAREAARNAVSFQLAQELNTRAIATFDQVIDNQEDAQETINAAAAKANFTGFQRVGETWVFRLKINHLKNDKAEEVYTYYCLYACDKEVYQEIANKYLSDIIGKVVKSENMQKANELRDGLIAETAENGFKGTGDEE